MSDGLTVKEEPISLKNFDKISFKYGVWKLTQKINS